MSKKLGINLAVSPQMDEAGENSTLRLSAKSREELGIDKDIVFLTAGNLKLELSVRQAYRGDLLRLSKRRHAGQITEAEARSTAFVTSMVYEAVHGGKKLIKETWLAKAPIRLMTGCDPEFGLVDDEGILQLGEDVLPHSKMELFGEDGPGVEVRPAPSLNHIEVVRNIRTILGKAPKAARKFKWIGGATYHDENRVYWFGGHIHFGKVAGVPVGYEKTAFQAVAKLLDHCLALPLLSFDTPEPFLRRKGCEEHHYGMAGDIRPADHGGYEYRVLSGLWATHPTLATVVMGVAKAVAEDFYTRAAQVSYSPEFLTNGYKNKTFPGYSLQSLLAISTQINKAKMEPMKPVLRAYWHSLLDSLSTKDLYAEEIAALKLLVDYSPDKVVGDLCMDLKQNWEEGRPLLPNPPDDLRHALLEVEKKK